MPLYFFIDYKNEIFNKLHGWKSIPEPIKIFLGVFIFLVISNFIISVFFTSIPSIVQIAILGTVLIIYFIFAAREEALFKKDMPNKKEIYKTSLKELIELLKNDEYNFYTKEKILWLIENYREKLTEMKPKNNYIILEMIIIPIVLLFLEHLIESDLSLFIYSAGIFLLVVFSFIFIQFMIQIAISLGDTLIYKRLKEQLEYILLENFES